MNMPPENCKSNGALYLADGTKLMDVTEIPEFVDTSDPADDDLVISCHFPEEITLTGTLMLTKRQLRTLMKPLWHHENCLSRAVRRMKRKREQERRKRLKKGLR